MWNKMVLYDIMTIFIVMHNMTIEDELDINATIEKQVEVPNAKVEMTSVNDARFQKKLVRHNKIKDRNDHFKLRDALIEHLWDGYDNSNN